MSLVQSCSPQAVAVVVALGLGPLQQGQDHQRPWTAGTCASVVGQQQELEQEQSWDQLMDQGCPFACWEQTWGHPVAAVCPGAGPFGICPLAWTGLVELLVVAGKEVHLSLVQSCSPQAVAVVVALWLGPLQQRQDHQGPWTAGTRASVVGQ